MTVRELIEALETLDPELPVFVDAAEDGFNLLETPKPLIVKKRSPRGVAIDEFDDWLKNDAWYYGDWEQAKLDTPESIKGVYIGRYELDFSVIVSYSKIP